MKTSLQIHQAKNFQTNDDDQSQSWKPKQSYLDSVAISPFDQFASQSERNAKSSSEITLNILPGQRKQSPEIWKKEEHKQREN